MRSRWIRLAIFEAVAGRGSRGLQCDPIAQRETSNVQDQLNNDQLPTPGRLAGLCLPGRCRRSIDAVSNATNDTSNDHMGNAVGRNLKQGADAHDSRPDQDAPFAAEDITEEEGGQGAEEASNVVNSCDRSLERCVVCDAEGVEEILGHDDAAEDLTLSMAILF